MKSPNFETPCSRRLKFRTDYDKITKYSSVKYGKMVLTNSMEPTKVVSISS